MPDDEGVSSNDRPLDIPDDPKHDSGQSDDGFGDDFDDFEAGGEADDFGDFGDGFEQPSAEPEPSSPEPPPVQTTPFVSSSNYVTDFHAMHFSCVTFLVFQAVAKVIR